MIGALNMFDVSPINAGMQAGMQRGAVNSPFTPLGQALKGTLDMYNKNRATQQEHQNKLGLLQKEYDLKKSVFSGTTDPDAAGPITQKDPTTGKYFYKSTTIDSNGSPKVSWAPVSPNAPENLKQTYMNEEVWGPLLEDRGAEPQTSPIPGVDAPVPAAKPVAAAPVPQAGTQRIRVISPDGKPGSVPASQLQDALKQGFKRI